MTSKKERNGRCNPRCTIKPISGEIRLARISKILSISVLRLIDMKKCQEQAKK